MEMIPCWYEYYFLAFQELQKFIKREGWEESHQFLLSVWCLQSTLLSLQCYLNFLVCLLIPRHLTESCMHSTFLLCVSHFLPITLSLFPSPSRYLEARRSPENSHCAVFFHSVVFSSQVFSPTHYSWAPYEMCCSSNVDFSFQMHIK